MINEKMYQELSLLESDELCERIANGGLSKEGYEIHSKILNERGVNIPIQRAVEDKSESFFSSIKNFTKERPFVSLIVLCGVVSVAQKLIQSFF